MFQTSYFQLTFLYLMDMNKIIIIWINNYNLNGGAINIAINLKQKKNL